MTGPPDRETAPEGAASQPIIQTLCQKGHPEDNNLRDLIAEAKARHPDDVQARADALLRHVGRDDVIEQRAAA
jgi:hypothetical protein